MFKAVIFDIDGTLLNSVDQHALAWQETFEHFGFSFPLEKIRSQIGKGGDKLLLTFLTQEQCDEFEEKMNQFRSQLFKDKYLSTCTPFPKVKELFEALRAAGTKVALGSSAKKDEIETYKKMLGIEGLVDQALSSDDVEASKPDPDVVTAARKQLGNLAAVDCCFVGDSPFDAAAARQDGTLMVGLLCGGFPKPTSEMPARVKFFRTHPTCWHAGSQRAWGSQHVFASLSQPA